MDPVLQFLIPHPENLIHVLLILMTVIWTTGRIFAYFNIPNIIGEIIAGILIGPAVLGLIPESHTIEVLAELGVFFIMFHSGLDTDIEDLVKSSKLSIALASGSIISLFIVGWGALTLLDYPNMTAIFMGTIISVTSFPMIARVLKEFNLSKTKIGHAILGATVVDDIAGFVLLSVVTSMATMGEITVQNLGLVALKVITFFVGTLFVGRLILPYFKKFLNTVGTKGFTLSLLIAFLFGFLAEAIGLHFILGAFLGGMFTRQEISDLKQFSKIEDRYYGLAYSFLGPIFFASIGMMVSPEIFTQNVGLSVLLLLIILFGQWIGTGGMAYLYGKFNFRESTAIASAASCRGVMEIVIAKIGFDTLIIVNGVEQRLISEDLFSAVIAVSLATTFLAPFFLKMALPPGYGKKLKYN